MKHKDWGEIEEDWAGYSAEIEFGSKLFFDKKITIFLGDEYDENGEEVEFPPPEEILDAYYSSYKNFQINLCALIEKIKEASFTRFLNLYFDSLLFDEIRTKDEHFKYLSDILYIRISEEGTIRIPIHYSEIDAEHGIEIRISPKLDITLGGKMET